MSSKGIQEVLSRAMIDAEFAESLFADVENALAGYDLTVDEIADFNNLALADVESPALEERKSFSILSIGEERDY